MYLCVCIYMFLCNSNERKGGREFEREQEIHRSISKNDKRKGEMIQLYYNLKSYY